MPATPLDREEYVEQAYFFRVLRERIEDNTPVQEALQGLHVEILATTRLPLAIDFLLGELNLKGNMGRGMERLSHYFTPFQIFLVQCAEDAATKFDFRIALRILQQEAEFRAEGPPSPAALFIFQFECLSRNQLGYNHGMAAVAGDPVYPPDWTAWIQRIRFDLGTVDFADMLYLRSQQHVEDVRARRREPEYTPSYPVLFDVRAGRIARANLGRDPLYLFAALQRQLGYPSVPRPAPARSGPAVHPQLEMRLQRLEARLGLVEQEQRGQLDLSQFYSAGGVDSVTGVPRALPKDGNPG